MIVLETEYMKVEIVPIDQRGEDPIYGEINWKGEFLRVTVKTGILSSNSLIDKTSEEYIKLLSETPTILFSLIEPIRK